MTEESWGVIPTPPTLEADALPLSHPGHFPFKSGLLIILCAGFQSANFMC